MKKEKIVYSLLNLPFERGFLEENFKSSEYIKMGYFSPREVEGALEKVSNAYCHIIDSLLKYKGLQQNSVHALQILKWIRFKEYQKLFRAFKSHESLTDRTSLMVNPDSRKTKEYLVEDKEPLEQTDFTDKRKVTLRDHFRTIEEATEETYYEAIKKCDVKKLTRFFESSLTLYIPEEARKRHTIITARTGGAKSELAKQFVYHYLTVYLASCVLIDPKYDFAHQVAHFKEFATKRFKRKLIYFDPSIDGKHIPVINVFDIPERIRKDPKLFELTVRVLSEEITRIFDTIMGVGTVTANMTTILEPTIRILLEMGDASLFDLKRFLNDDPELIQRGIDSNDPILKDFFQNDFQDKMYKQTKEAVVKKIQYFLNKPLFYQCTTGKNTFDLEQAINDRKIIVFNFPEGVLGEETSRTLSLLAISMVTGIALRRAKLSSQQKVPCHVFVDESEKVANSLRTILTKTRSYGVHLTMISQVEGQGMQGKEMKDILRECTDIKIRGRGSEEPYKSLKIGEYFIQVGNSSFFKFRNMTNLLDYNHSMEPHEWEQTKEFQIKRFYRKIDKITEEQIISPTTEKSKKDTPTTDENQDFDEVQTSIKTQIQEPTIPEI